MRRAREDDVPDLLPLMRGLAEFERYADRFAVTEDVLREQGFRRSPPDFHCLVAEGPDGALIGMLVFYLVPFTFTARPTLYIKELFVAPAGRGHGVGERLMREAAREATARGCGATRWQVARWNGDAQRFYARLGARADDEWIDYGLSEREIHALARGLPNDLD